MKLRMSRLVPTLAARGSEKETTVGPRDLGSAALVARHAARSDQTQIGWEGSLTWLRQLR